MASCLLLFALGFGSRWPLRTRVLFHWDSVNYAYALTRLDLGQSRPHPPGYPLYVFAGRLAAELVPDANAALVLVGAVATGVGAVALYLLGKEAWGAGWAVVLPFLASPLMWAQGEVALPFAAELGASCLLGLVCWRLHQGRSKGLLASFGLGLAAGIRPELLALLGPVLLYSAARGRALRWVPAMALLGLLGVLLWAFPLVRAAGGLGAYRAINAAKWETDTRYLTVLATGLRGFLGNLKTLAKLEYWSLGGGVLLLAPLFSPAARSSLRKAGSPFSFAFVWVLPGLAWWSFFRAAHPGHVAATVPPLFFVLGGVYYLARAVLPRTRAAFAAAVVLSTAAYLGAGSVRSWGRAGRLLVCRECALFSYQGLRTREEMLRADLASLAAYPPSSSAIITYHFSGAAETLFRHAMWYLPEVRVFLVLPQGRDAPTLTGYRGVVGFTRGEIRLPGVSRVLLFGDDPRPFLDPPLPLRRIAPHVWVLEKLERFRFGAPSDPGLGVVFVPEEGSG